jgi:hypothetical protein
MTERLYPDDDPIMEELYRIRAERLAEYGGDWLAMLRDIQAKQEAGKLTGSPVKSSRKKTKSSTPSSGT